jgi:hypothetical protein
MQIIYKHTSHNNVYMKCSVYASTSCCVVNTVMALLLMKPGYKHNTHHIHWTVVSKHDETKSHKDNIDCIFHSDIAIVSA